MFYVINYNNKIWFFFILNLSPIFYLSLSLFLSISAIFKFLYKYMPNNNISKKKNIYIYIRMYDSLFLPFSIFYPFFEVNFCNTCKSCLIKYFSRSICQFLLALNTVGDNNFHFITLFYSYSNRL